MIHGVEIQISTQRKSEAVRILTLLIAILSIVQSAGGLLISSLYRDGPWVLAAWRGNDVVTLLIAAPLLIGAALLGERGSQRAHLVRLGMLFYMFYNYGYYVFGAALNRFFLVYVAVFALSAYALILSLLQIGGGGPGDQFCGSAIARKTTAAYTIALGVLISSIWIVQWCIFLVSGQPPRLGGSEDAFRLVASMDISVQVPALVLGGILLWWRNPWGYLMAVIMNVADAVYMLVLLGFSPFAARSGIENPWQQAPLWAVLCVACSVSSLVLLRNSAASQRTMRA